ncbi:MAG: hypothetical protein Q9218_005166, partial [Villophora microphyllina]
MEIQTVEQRYVDMKKLLKLLNDLFGKRKCEVEVQDEYVVLTAPRLLTEFIEKDQFQAVKLDAKLPTTLPALEDILPSQTTAGEFFDLQWEFTSPEFTYSVLHRSLHPSSVLPFIGGSKDLGEGGFGTVTEVILPQIILQGVNIKALVRKEFKSAAEYKSEWASQREQDNLHILCRLKHPNITPLISSYKFRGKVNFLFPRAQGGDLHELLRTRKRPSELASDSVFLLALCRLSSAIEAVHSFTIEELDLSMIGCHHDLKPRNILVHGEDFMLTDFGLARLKPATESSKSDFVAGPPWYLAPECEDYEDECEKHTISRPSDIWSFGCILAESVTYLLGGAEAVIKFQQERKVRLGIVTNYTFHAGRFSPSPGVISWIQHLQKTASSMAPHLLSLLPLIQKMLAMSPTERPSALEVTSILRQVFLSTRYHQLLESFRRGSLACDSYDLKAEYERFRIWGFVCDLEPITDLSRNSWRSTSPDLAFEPTVNLLKLLEEHLQDMAVLGSEDIYTLQHSIVKTNDELCDLLPPGLQRQLQVRLEQELVTKANPEELIRAGQALTTTPMHKRLGMLATIKHVSEVAASRKTQARPELQLEAGMISCPDRGGEYDLGSVTNLSQGRVRRVLVEYVKYDLHWEGDVTEEMIVRIEAIAEMHSHNEKPANLRSLHCTGFYHVAHKHAFAIVYDFPIDPATEAEITQVYSLKAILEQSQNWRERPILDHRYRLAGMLAVSLLEFHSVKWLHKSLSASHVVFFGNETKTDRKMMSVKGLQDPYIIGFNRSRPDEPAAFTDGPGTGGDSRIYQHPQYAERKHHHRPEFDYYSLGLVLLEIGLWMPLANMLAGRKFSSFEEQRNHLLVKYTPLLGHSVGSKYATAVRVCLEDFGSADLVEDSSDSKLLRFSDEVVERLR